MATLGAGAGEGAWAGAPQAPHSSRGHLGPQQAPLPPAVAVLPGLLLGTAERPGGLSLARHTFHGVTLLSPGKQGSGRHSRGVPPTGSAAGTRLLWQGFCMQGGHGASLPVQVKVEMVISSLFSIGSGQ